MKQVEEITMHTKKSKKWGWYILDVFVVSVLLTVVSCYSYVDGFQDGHVVGELSERLGVNIIDVNATDEKLFELIENQIITIDEYKEIMEAKKSIKKIEFLMRRKLIVISEED